MKKYLIIIATLAACTEPEKEQSITDNALQKDTITAPAQQTKNIIQPDQSPMDMVYFPNDYPIQKMMHKGETMPLARIIYSRPQTQGRKIFGELIQYNRPWRLGANEATEIEFFSPATIQNKTLKPQRYIMYCIPEEKKWTIVFNSNLYSWGLKQDESKDQLRFEIPVQMNDQVIEHFSMLFDGKGKKANLLIMWDDVKASLAISF